MAEPLREIRVLEMGQLIAGPFAAKMLAEFGAEVIKIEPPVKGDPLRKWRLLHDGTSVWWHVQSRNCHRRSNNDPRAGVNRTHLGDDDGFLAINNVDSGASSGDKSNGATRHEHTRDGQGVGVCAQYRSTVFA